jgi:hypothetical protein
MPSGLPRKQAGLFASLLLCFALTAACSCVLVSGNHEVSLERVGRIDSPAVTEASGLAVSHRDPGLLWVNNDSGDTATLYCIDKQGRLKGRINLKGIEARDWEDVASFVLDGQPMLLVADTGDNRSVRNDVCIHVFPEPDPSSLSPDKAVEVSVNWTIPFSYEDGPKDCESVAIDASERMIYLVSKRRDPPCLYALPLSHDAGLVARSIAKIRFIPRPSLCRKTLKLPSWRYRDQPTGLDISGSRAVLLSYGEAFLIERKQGQTWAQSFEGPVTTLPAHGLTQAEAICFDAEGRDIFVTGEGHPQPLLRYHIRRSP